MSLNQKNDEIPFDVFTLFDDFGEEVEHVILDKFFFEFENENSEYWVTSPKETYLDSDEVYMFRYTTQDGEPFLDDDLSGRELDKVLEYYEKRCKELIEKYGGFEQEFEEI